MTNSQRLATVRRQLLYWIANQSDPGVSEKITRETLLIRDDFYVGRRFYTPSYRAVWFIEEDQLKICQGQRLVAVLSAAEIDAIAPGASDNPFSDRQHQVIKLPPPVDRGDDRDETIRRVA